MFKVDKYSFHFTLLRLIPTDVIATVTLYKSLAVVIKLDLNSQDSVWIYIKRNKKIKL